MIELINADQLARATERAKTSNLFVQPSSIFRQYKVTNRANGNQYTVNFFVRKDGKRFGSCTCKGGAAGFACKHLAAAAGLHVCIAAQKRVA
jgi:uncharacterized Zn finger protein